MQIVKIGILINFLRATLSIAFIASSLLKVISLQTFAIETGDYIDLYMPHWLHGWNMLCAVGICILELTVGILLIWRKQLVWTSAMALLLLTFFVWLTGVNMFFPTIFGSIESCGCFGELIHFTPIASFFKSLILWCMAIVLLAILIKRNGLVLFEK